MTIERCFFCSEPTERAGKGEDSIYLGELGPFCITCYEQVKDAILAEQPAPVPDALARAIAHFWHKASLDGLAISHGAVSGWGLAADYLTSHAAEFEPVQAQPVPDALARDYEEALYIIDSFQQAFEEWEHKTIKHISLRWSIRACKGLRDYLTAQRADFEPVKLRFRFNDEMDEDNPGGWYELLTKEDEPAECHYRNGKAITITFNGKTSCEAFAADTGIPCEFVKDGAE